MIDTRKKVAIVGVAYTPTVSHTEKSLGSLAVEACRAAVEDAGLTMADIDGISNYPNPSRIGAGDKDGVDLVSVKYLAPALKLKNLSWTCSITTGTITASLVQAVNAVASGNCTAALVWRAMHNPTGKFGSFKATHVGGDAQFDAPYGFANNIMIFAFGYSQYMAKYGATREHMATYVVNSRKNASLNPNAVHYRQAITREDYMKARMITEPMSLFDCDRPVDGCGAVVVTTAERAKDLKQRPVYVAGGATGGFKYHHAPILDLETAMDGGRVTAKALWRNAGMGPKDIDFGNIYDGFSFFIYTWLESFGFCKEGEAFQFIQNGRIELGGEFPINPSGGAIGMGRLHGTPQLLEGVLQLQGRGGERQLKKANTTIVNSGSALGNGAVVLTNA